jgi:hypothetical protein
LSLAAGSPPLARGIDAIHQHLEEPDQNHDWQAAQPRRRWPKDPADHARELASEVVQFERDKLTRDSPRNIRGLLIGAARLLSDVEHDLRG